MSLIHPPIQNPKTERRPMLLYISETASYPEPVKNPKPHELISFSKPRKKIQKRVENDKPWTKRARKGSEEQEQDWGN